MSWELGEPLTYTVGLGPGNIPLSVSTIWPEDMTDRSAEWYARMVEQTGSRLIGAIVCPGSHESLTAACGDCGAVV